MSDINKKKLYFTFVLFIAIAFFSLINGCGKNNPLTPGISNTGNEEVFSDNGNNDPYPNLPGFDKSFNFRDSTPGYRDYSNNIDGFTGGTITADDTTGLHQVVFQPGVWGGVMYTPCGIGNYVTPFGNVICFRFDADCFGYGIGNWAKIIVDVSSYRTTSRSDKMGRLIGAYVYLKDGCTNSWDIVDSVELAENDNDVTINTTF
ncbi:MAG: hypothetical protein GY855_05150, partial [candidate division Zixibacteria bacterium]|nr:hypothetical protein [candidate division Zixibacteria bacterium]